MNNLIELVNKKLDEYLQITYPEAIFNSMKYSLMLPGKRLRPVMCLETVRMLGAQLFCRRAAVPGKRQRKLLPDPQPV